MVATLSVLPIFNPDFTKRHIRLAGRAPKIVKYRTDLTNLMSNYLRDLLSLSLSSLRKFWTRAGRSIMRQESFTPVLNCLQNLYRL